VVPPRAEEVAAPTPEATTRGRWPEPELIRKVRRTRRGRAAAKWARLPNPTPRGGRHRACQGREDREGQKPKGGIRELTFARRRGLGNPGARFYAAMRSQCRLRVGRRARRALGFPPLSGRVSARPASPSRSGGRARPGPQAHHYMNASGAALAIAPRRSDLRPGPGPAHLVDDLRSLRHIPAPGRGSARRPYGLKEHRERPHVQQYGPPPHRAWARCPKAGATGRKYVLAPFTPETAGAGGGRHAAAGGRVIKVKEGTS